MPKSFIKGFLVVLVVAVIGLVPGNSQLLFGYGDTAPWRCSQATPEKVVFYQPNHSLLPKTAAKGEVILNWLKLSDKADRYTIAYGVQPGTYIYGLPDVGNVNSFTVNYLSPGTRYYFVVRGVNSCMPGPWSQEWSAVAPGGVGGGIVATIVTPQTTVAPKTTAPKTTVTPKTQVQPQPKGGAVPTEQPAPVETPKPLTFWQRVGQWFGGLFK